MHLQHRIAKKLIAIKEGVTVYTSLAYNQDYKRRALNLLKQEGYFVQNSRFSFTRTSKVD